MLGSTDRWRALLDLRLLAAGVLGRQLCRNQLAAAAWVLLLLPVLNPNGQPANAACPRKQGAT